MFPDEDPQRSRSASRTTRSIPTLSGIGALLFLLFGCSGGGGGGFVGPVTPPTSPPAGPASAVHAGLLSAAAGDSEVRVLWDLPKSGFEAALFHAADEATLFSGMPAQTALAGSGTTVSGLTNGQSRFFGLGVRPVGGTTWTPSGAVLRARPAAPIYVDASAPAQGANGTSPASAFPALIDGLLAAAGQGGGNVWVRDGEYGPGLLPVGAGVHVYGGFDAAFDLATRDPAGERTVVTSQPNQPVFDVRSSGDGVIFDGLLLDGRSTGFIGIDLEDSDMELRTVTVRGFVDRGIRLRNGSVTDVLEVQLTNCFVHSNRADGLSLLGAFELRVDFCRFDSNVQEGIDLDDLIAPDGRTVLLQVTDSRFFGNGAEGVDVDLAQPPLATTGSGLFLVTIEGCRFEANGLDGLLVDQEHEAVPDWRARIVVRECEAKNNANAGVHIDADADADYLLHRIRAVANGSDGIWISSETQSGHVVVSHSYLAGNLQAGIRASLGNKIVTATHSVFAGNLGGGFVSTPLESTATSCISHLQDNPWQGVRVHRSPDVSDPSMQVFVNAPIDYAAVLTNNQGSLTLDRNADFAAGDTVELADDGTARMASQVSGPSVVLDGSVGLLRLPALLTAWPPSSSVDEDLQLAPGSPVAGMGMTTPGGPAVDPGIFGGPAAGAPGTGDPLSQPLFWLEGIDPTTALGPSGSQAITLLFSRDLDPATVTADRVRVVDGSGSALTVGLTTTGNQLQLTPPPAGWGLAPLRLEVHRELGAADGTAFSTPLTIPLSPR